MNLLHISDIHFRRTYERCGDGYKGMLYSMQSPLVPLEHCLKTVLKNRKIDLLVISGDLTEDGEAEDYAFLRDDLQKLIGRTKIVVTLGNHDNKANFRTGWLSEKASVSSYNQICYLKDLVVISFDTSLQNCINGKIGKDQLAWLKAAFQQTGNTPVILVTHHHLLDGQSTIPAVEGAQNLLDAIRNEKILCVLTGHTHHPYAGTAAGKPYFTAGSMSFCGEDTESGAIRFQEKYGYNLYRIENGEITEQKTETFTTGKIIKTVFL